MLDLEGWQLEGGKLKAMGLDLKKTDTPEFVQDFLTDILGQTLNGDGETSVLASVREFKKESKAMDLGRKVCLNVLIT